MKFKCPYCDKDVHIQFETVPWNDGDYITVDCTSCTKPFEIWAYATIDHSIEEIHDD